MRFATARPAQSVVYSRIVRLQTAPTITGINCHCRDCKKASIRPATAGLSEATTSNNADQVPITVLASTGLHSSLPSALAFTGASTLLLVMIGGFFLGSGTLATAILRRKR